jgi:hypothetical protein
MAVSRTWKASDQDEVGRGQQEEQLGMPGIGSKQLDTEDWHRQQDQGRGIADRRARQPVAKPRQQDEASQRVSQTGQADGQAALADQCDHRGDWSDYRPAALPMVVRQAWAMLDPAAGGVEILPIVPAAADETDRIDEQNQGERGGKGGRPEDRGAAPDGACHYRLVHVSQLLAT